MIKIVIITIVSFLITFKIRIKEDLKLKNEFTLLVGENNI